MLDFMESARSEEWLPIWKALSLAIEHTSTGEIQHHIIFNREAVAFVIDPRA